MRPLSAFFAIVLATVLTVAASAQRGPLPTPLIKEGVTEKISDHVWVIPDGNVALVPNVAIVVGSRATFVVDTGLGARNAGIVLREVAKVSRNSELYLATTHVHPEHDLGAHAFPASTRMVRSQDQVKEIADTGLQTAKQFATFSPAVAEMLQGADFRKADVVFEQEQVFDLGGTRVRAIAMGANHTRGDTAFFVEPDGILVSGDVVMSRLPQFSSPASRVSIWLQSMDRFEKLQPKRIVPSHGAMGDASMIANYRAFLTTVRDRAAALKKEGVSIDDAVKRLQDELQPRFTGNMAGAIRAAWNEAP
jgi:glyoxylase-like metal-dependent hydrolase (beta-lactamase superfamily II)